MGFKTGGLKAIYRPPTSGYEPERVFTIYTACESVSDISGYIMLDEKGNKVSIMEYWEDDTAVGQESLIDVLYYLKHYDVGVYDFGAKWREITIEAMTSEEMEKLFINKDI